MTHRIAFVNSALPAGGGTVFLVNLGGELTRRQIPVHVFSLTAANPLAADFERNQIPVTVARAGSRIFEDRIEDMLREISRFQPTTAVTNLDLEACEVIRHLPSGLPRIGVLHALHQIGWAAKYIQFLDAVVTVSKYSRDLLVEKPQFKPLPIHCIELGFPIPDEVNRDHLMSGAPLRILYLGRLEDPAKRVRLFPVILKQLIAAGIPFTWTVAGEGPEDSFLRSQMTSASPSQQVVFKGLVRYADVPALLEQNDVILLVSDSEVFPLSLQEGMAAGLVPVVSNLPGRIREIVLPDAGILVDPSEVTKYAEAVIWLHQHRELMRKMSAKARDLIGREYSISAMTDRWVARLAANEPQTVNWPDSWKISRPIFGRENWRFSQPGRGLRRLAARLDALLPRGRQSV